VAVTAEAILGVFEDRGLRNTRPRRLIAERLAQLAERGEDFATDELWADLQRAEPGIGRATAFRAVEVLAAEGILDRVEFADGTHRYRLCSARHHHHLTCTRCHRVVEIDVCLPPEQLSGVARQNDFALEGHALQLFGRCAACREMPG